MNTRPRITIPACTCSAMQLEHVGCDCPNVDAWIAAPKDTVVVWADGYASDRGRRTFKVLAGTPRAEVEADARRIFGSFAIIAYITPAPVFGPPTREHFDPAYVAMMSRDS